MATATATAKQSGFKDKLAAAGDWLRLRITNIDIFDEHHQLEAKTNPFYSLGPIFYLVWFVVMATGCILIMWYVPTKAAAFDSIFEIQTRIPFGGLMRGMHKYGADAMIIAATMRMYRMFINADYKPGKEFNIAIALVTLLLCLYSGLTGYLLIWNQRAFWATKVFATFPTYMDQFPVMGDFYQPLVKSLHMGWNTAEVLLGGGAAITQETITRFFSLHLAFSLIPLILVELYFYKNAYARMPINWTKRIIVILMLVVVAIILPAAQGHRSNPDVTPLPILSDWYFLGLYQMYKYLEPVVATEITMVIPITVIMVPFLDTWIAGPEKDIMKRPLVLMTTIMGFLSWIIFSLLIIANIANIHTDPPYWRLFTYGLVDIGVLWQLLLMWNETNALARVKAAGGAMTMAILMGIQSVVSVIFYFQAKTEIFADPLLHSFLYSLSKPFGSAPLDQAEGLVRKAMEAGQKDYWNFPTLLDPATIKTLGAPTAEPVLRQMQQLAQQPTGLDWLYKLIPTFTPAPHAQYQGMVDFMLNNRWCFDYVTFCDRMNGVAKPYPIEIPGLDVVWMILGPVCMIACLVVWNRLKTAPAPAAAAQPATATAAST